MILKQGFLIAFEGIDGAGKTTQANLLYEKLLKRGACVVQSKEPTDSIYGQKIKRLAAGERQYTSPEEEYLLFINDRRIHVENFIKPYLEKNHIVILDRYYFSTIAYQGALGLDPKKIQADNEAFAPIPEFVILIEVPPKLGIRRIEKSRGEVPNAFEKEEYLTKVDKFFNSLNENYILRLNGAQRRSQIHNTIINVVNDVLEHYIDRLEQCVLFENQPNYK